MSDIKAATDAEVAQFKRYIETGPGLSQWAEMSLIARIEQDGERMREMEGAIQRVGREAGVHTHPVGNAVRFEGHLVPNRAMMQLLAALKEAPDA